MKNFIKWFRFIVSDAIDNQRVERFNSLLGIFPSQQIAERQVCIGFGIPEEFLLQLLQTIERLLHGFAFVLLSDGGTEILASVVEQLLDIDKLVVDGDGFRQVADFGS